MNIRVRKVTHAIGFSHRTLCGVGYVPLVLSRYCSFIDERRPTGYTTSKDVNCMACVAKGASS